MLPARFLNRFGIQSGEFFFKTCCAILMLCWSMSFSADFVHHVVYVALVAVYFVVFLVGSFWVKLVSAALYLPLVYILWLAGYVDNMIGTPDSHFLVLLMPFYIGTILLRSGSSAWVATLTIFGFIVCFPLTKSPLFSKTNSANSLEPAFAREHAPGHVDCGYTIDHDLGYRRKANCVGQKTNQVLGDELLSEYFLKTDENAERVNPAPARTEGRLIFIGGSRVFGDGVRDDQTLPYYLSDLTGIRGDIWALSGWGIGQNAFLLSERFEDVAEIAELDPVTFVYVAYIGHVGRSAGGYIETLYYHPNYPRFEVADGQVAKIGRLRNYSFKKYILYSSLHYFCERRCRALNRLGYEAAPYSDLVQFVANKVQEIPNARLIVVLHPGKSGSEIESYVDLKQLFQDAGHVEVLDATGLYPEKRPYVIHPVYDGHLSAEGNKRLAEFVNQSVFAQ
ncbi:hypothetical protein [Ruegeria sp.]|uniref:hypothetical protein n=1 Tax=Ruegeria sp. TaxID=1879320 RepID=UPI003C7C7A90